MLGALKKNSSYFCAHSSVFYFFLWPVAESKAFLPQSGAEVNHTPNEGIEGMALLRMVLTPTWKVLSA